MDDVGCDANASIGFVLRDTDDAKSFHPEYTHMCFGDDEKIRGWKQSELDIVLQLRVRRLFRCVTTCTLRERGVGDDVESCGEGTEGRGRKVEKIDTQGGRREDPLALLAPLFEPGEDGKFTVTTNATGDDDGGQREEDRDKVEKLCVRGMRSLATDLPGGFELVSLRLGEDADESVRNLHSRLQSLAPFFINGASRIESDDSRWRLILIARLSRDESGEFATLESLAGFATVYGFFSYPRATRLRLGQCLVLPPFRGSGHGAALMRGVYALADAEERDQEVRDSIVGVPVLDVTVEDPTDQMQLIHVKVDVARMDAAGGFGAEVAKGVEAAIEACSGDDADAGWKVMLPSSDVIARARSRLKINPRQLRRCWECLLLRAAIGAPWEAELTQILHRVIKERIHEEYFATLKEKTGAEKKVREAADADASAELFMRFTTRTHI